MLIPSLTLPTYGEDIRRTRGQRERIINSSESAAKGATYDEKILTSHLV